MLINGLGIGVPYKTFRGAGETLNQSSLYLPLKSTIVPSKGTSTPTFTRATAAWSFDNEGKLNLNIPSGCARFKGGRLVRNRIGGTSEDFSSGTWLKKDTTITSDVVTAPDGSSGMDKLIANSNNTTHYLYKSSITVSGGDIYTVSVYVKAQEFSLFQLTFSGGNVAGDPRINFDLSTGQISAISAGITGTILYIYDNIYRVSCTVTCASTTLIPLFCLINTATASRTPSFSGDDVSGLCLWGIQGENVSGRSDQTPSEYVSVGVLSSPYHGAGTAAGADGCKWFPTNKDGSAISTSTLEGYLAEPSRTNNCLWNRDLTNVAWTNTNITAAKTATGLDNVSNSATRLTAAANDATLLQLLTAATGTRTLSAYIKRVSGTGTISLTRDGGTNWTDITSSLVTGSWVLVQMTSDVGANPTVGIKMGTSGDVIDVDCVQDENGAWATSPILTTTAAVTRNADVLSYANAFDVAQGTALCSLRSDVPVNSGSIIYALQGGTGGSASFVYTNSADARTISRAYDGVNAASLTSSDITTGIRKKAVRWGTDLVCAGDGILGTVKPFDGSMGVSSTLFVGCNSISTEPLSGTIRDVHIWPTPLTDTQMKQVTT